MLDLFRPLVFRDHPLRQAQRTIEQIKSAGVLPRIEQLGATLAHCTERLESMADKARLLDLLDEPAQLTIGLLKEALAETEPGSARVGLLLRHGQQLANAMLYQSADVVVDRPDDRDLVALFLRWAATALFLQRMLQGSAETLNWRRLIAPLCEKTEAGDDFRIELARIHPETGQQLGRLALLSMVLPLALDVRQLLIAEQLTAYLGGKVLLSPVFLPSAPYVVTLLSQGRPEQLEGWERAGDDLRALFLGFDEVDKTAADWRAALVAGSPLDKVLRPLPGQSIAETLAMIDLLRTAWSSRQRTRSEPRTAIEGTLWACCDTLRIRSLLAQPVKKHPVADSLVCETSLFNISRRGVGVLFPADYLHARIGGLIALYQPQRDTWALGIIRRACAEADGQRFVGVELLSETASAASVVDDTGQRQPGLLLPACGDRGLPALLLPAPTLSTGQSYRINCDKQDRNATVESFLLAGNDFALYQMLKPTEA